jgi:hypothetical protein
MKGIKSFDFFQKIAVDNVTQPTIVGSFLSLSAICLIAFLLIKEVIHFFTLSIKRESIIFQDPDQKSKINVNMHIDFFNIPCSMLSVDQEDQVGNHRMDISDTLQKLKYKPGSTEHVQEKNLVNVDQVVRQVNEGEGCRIVGHVPINKVPGNIHISHHNYADLFYYLKSERKDLFAKISLNHKISNFFFGDRELNSKILDRFGYNEMESSFYRMAQLPKYEDINKKNFDYYIKIIPHLFVDEIRGETFLGYQYSMTTRERDFNTQGNEMPIVFLNYDLSPITMKVTLQRKSFAHALTHVCAIVGGVYVIFSILNRLLLSLCDFSANDKKGVAASG